MLTPIDIQSKTFKSGMGYSKADVDSFFKSLASDFETLYRENLELKDKVNILNEGINHYKGIEKSMQKHCFLRKQQLRRRFLPQKRMQLSSNRNRCIKSPVHCGRRKNRADRVGIRPWTFCTSMKAIKPSTKLWQAHSWIF